MNEMKEINWQILDYPQSFGKKSNLYENVIINPQLIRAITITFKSIV